MPYTATFTPADPVHRALLTQEQCRFDVTPEIEALGGAIPRADSNGTDLMHLATNAPDWVKNYRYEFTISVAYTDEAVPVE
jgi:hypothetical protein